MSIAIKTNKYTVLWHFVARVGLLALSYYASHSSKFTQIHHNHDNVTALTRVLRSLYHHFTITLPSPYNHFQYIFGRPEGAWIPSCDTSLLALGFSRWAITHHIQTNSSKWLVLQSIHSWSPRGSLNNIWTVVQCCRMSGGRGLGVCYRRGQVVACRAINT